VTRSLTLPRNEFGVRAEARKTVATDLDVSDVILSTAANVGADLLVMGAYSRGLLAEAFLGDGLYSYPAEFQGLRSRTDGIL